MIDTITLVGRAPSSRHLIEKIPDDHVIYTIAACYDLPPRIDLCVEIHPYWAISNKNYARHMFEWMTEPHDFPILMQEVHEDIPASQVFPFDEVLNLAPVLRGSEDTRNRFLSSSFDYLMAIAILAKPRRIEVVGFDMSSDTEFRYQREGAAFWCGLAAGAGIEVWLPDESPMLTTDMLYGYEGAQAIKRERLEQLLVQYDGWIEETEREHGQKAAKLPKINGPTDDEETNAQFMEVANLRDMVFVLSGGKQTVEQLMENFMVEDITYRQALEGQRAACTHQTLTLLSSLNFFEGIVADRQQVLKDNSEDPHNRRIFEVRLEEAFQRKARVRDEYMTWKGGTQVLDQLIRECDFKYNNDWKPSAEVLQRTVEVK